MGFEMTGVIVRSYRNLSIHNKLHLFASFLIIVVLLLTFLAVSVNEFVQQRRSIINNLHIQAKIIISNSIGPLVFDYSKGADKILKSLSYSPDILYAAFYKNKTNPFAAYIRDGAEDKKDAFSYRDVGEYFEDRLLILSEPVIFNKETVGTLIIVSDMRDFYSLLKHSLTITGLIMIFAFMVTMLLSSKMQRVFSKPILNLTSLMQDISQKKDYSTRAEKICHDEIGLLVDGLNDMLSQIQKRDEELQNYRIYLEKQIAERTIELIKTTEKLEHELEERKKDQHTLLIRQKEIEQLNNNLKEEVEKEVEKSRQKDLIMLQQSRLAAMGDMIGNIAHQWRQPLSALNIILFNIQDLFDNKELDEENLKGFILQSNELILKMSSTIDDFRNFFKPNKDKDRFLINDVLKEALSILSASMRYYNIDISSFLHENISIEGYKNEFSHVILNLLNNSKDAIVSSKVKGAIKIRLCRDKGYAVVEVEDNGGGIPEAILDKIFEPYFTTKEEGKGIGIGLYMARMIIEEHTSGKIEVENIENGVIFRVLAPLD
ncbi:integral membrane sensor signal transduction histidine kinase [Candidatus Magnetoovum chiemensis]|nr:integral membrane sensor signal transduction histidine kinase [Candidatus Magnetoovum chiemensis]